MMQLLSIPENILRFIAAFGTLQGLLLAIFIYFHPKSDRSVTIFLALYVTCLSLVATTALVEHLVTWQKSFFIEPFPMLTGPFLYFYVRSFTERITWRKMWPHFIVFILTVPFAWWYIGKYADLYPHAKEVPAEALQDPIGIIFNLLKVSQFVMYFILTRRTLMSYQRSIRQLFSETTRIDLAWIKWLNNGYMIFILVTMATVGLMYKFPQHFNLWALLYVVLFTPYIYMAAFKGVTQPTIWQAHSNSSRNKVQKDIGEIATTNSLRTSKNDRLATDSKFETIVSGILQLMEKEKIFQETELTLQNLAAKINAPAYLVSQAINEQLKKNFYDLVNGYRVEEAKRLLVDVKTRNYTILSIGFEAGFNSKTTFNTVFKRFTGLTPTEYRDRRQQAAEVVR